MTKEESEERRPSATIVAEATAVVLEFEEAVKARQRDILNYYWDDPIWIEMEERLLRARENLVSKLLQVI